MTKAEAIRILEQSCPKRPQKLWSIKRKEAVKMAIEALRFADEYHKRTLEAYAHDMGVSLEQAERELRVEELSCSEKPNGSDTIYRQDAIDVAKQHWYKPDIAKALEDLPSAQPDNRLAKIADLVEGTIDHFDLDDAMDLLYQIKEVLKNG